MNTFICNKCSKTLQRGKRPFSLTQCGHIFCKDCIQQAEKQCPRCKEMGSMSIPLQEPLLPKVAEFFMPLSESLATLQKVDAFQNNQMKIILERFRAIEKKYESLKSHYYNAIQNVKELNAKYYKLRAENESLTKKLMYLEMHNSTINSSSNTSTPMNPLGRDRMKYTPSTNFSHTQSYKTSTITPVQRMDMSREYTTSDGFRIPYHKPLRSAGSETVSDISSTYTYRRKN